MAKVSYDPEVDALYIRGSGKVSSRCEIFAFTSQSKNREPDSRGDGISEFKMSKNFNL